MWQLLAKHCTLVLGQKWALSTLYYLNLLHFSSIQQDSHILQFCIQAQIRNSNIAGVTYVHHITSYIPNMQSATQLM